MNKWFRETLKCLCQPAVQFCRKVYNWQRRIRLHNHPTIISRDCVGGVLSHDLGLGFLSPTINLTMPAEDFILFCQHLEDFLATEMEEVTTHDMAYPIGRLVAECGTITLHLMHYDTFQHAKEAWERRKKRVDLNNIRLIFNTWPEAPETLLKEFEELPFSHKVLLTSGIDKKKYPHGYNLPCYTAGYDVSIIQYKSLFSIRRYQDHYDWISFLNGDK